jgi:hypothetical protein
MSIDTGARDEKNTPLGLSINSRKRIVLLPSGGWNWNTDLMCGEVLKPLNDKINVSS